MPQTYNPPYCSLQHLGDHQHDPVEGETDGERREETRMEKYKTGLKRHDGEIVNEFKKRKTRGVGVRKVSGRKMKRQRRK